MMFSRLLPLVVLLACVSGDFSQQPDPTVVLAGQVAILPCQYEDTQFVEWSRENLVPNVVLLYRGGKEEHGMKNKAFRYRTSLVRPEMDNSDKSLRIANVQLSDEGKYACLSGEVKVVSTVWLSVVTVSRPELTLVSSESGATVQCRVYSSLSNVEMEFVDDQGNILPCGEPKFDREDKRIFNMTRQMLVPDNITSITCRVNHAQINDTWSQTLSVPEYCKVSCWPNGIVIGTISGYFIIIIIIIIIAAIVICNHSKRGNDKLSAKASLQPSALSARAAPDRRPLMDDMDGSRVKVRPETGDGTIQKRQDKTPPPSAAVVPQPAQQPAAASSSTSSTGNKTLKGGKSSLAPNPNPKPVGEKVQSKSDTQLHKNPGRRKRTMSDCSGLSRPKNLGNYGQYLTVPYANRFSPLSEEHSDGE